MLLLPKKFGVLFREAVYLTVLYHIVGPIYFLIPTAFREAVFSKYIIHLGEARDRRACKKSSPPPAPYTVDNRRSLGMPERRGTVTKIIDPNSVLFY